VHFNPLRNKRFAPRARFELATDGKEAIVPQVYVGIMRVIIATIVLTLFSGYGVALPNADAPIIRTVGIGHGITLHYVDVGKGTPVIFVHGSLSDGGYWADQIGAKYQSGPLRILGHR
jgi:hypothetical protein